MKLETGIVKALSLCLLLVVLSACSAAPRRSESYTSTATGAVTSFDTPRESCVNSCNADFDRCGDTRAAESAVGRSGAFSGTLGAAADCKAALRSCLATCKGR